MQARRLMKARMFQMDADPMIRVMETLGRGHLMGGIYPTPLMILINGRIFRLNSVLR